jgi:thioredoxin-like negative regulator of GroEL
VPDEIRTFTAETWDGEVVRSPVPVVVGFWAEWCLPSRMALHAIETAARQYKGRLRFGLVDGDQSPELVRRYGIQGMPALLVVRGGEPEVRRVGLMGRQAMLDLLARHLGHERPSL